MLSSVGAVSRLTIGGRGIGQIWCETSAAEGIATLHYTVDEGGTLIDIASMFGSYTTVIFQAIGASFPPACASGFVPQFLLEL